MPSTTSARALRPSAGRRQPGDVGAATGGSRDRSSGTSAQTRTGRSVTVSTIRAIAGIAVRSPTSSSQPASAGSGEGALGLGDRHRVADAVPGGPLGDQPVVVDDHVEHQVAGRPSDRTV